MPNERNPLNGYSVHRDRSRIAGDATRQSHTFLEVRSEKGTTTLGMTCPASPQPLTPQLARQSEEMQTRIDLEMGKIIERMRALGARHVEATARDVEAACGFTVPQCTRAGRGQICVK